jgi:hypothetical protein
MRHPAVFTTFLAACSGGTAAAPPHGGIEIVRRATPDAFPAPDAPPPPLLPGARGDACAADHPCGQGLRCAPLPGGYCGSPCGFDAASCDGTCVETGRMGELCLKSCTRDDDCRSTEGYLCDPEWHACVLPNLAAIRPKQCPLVGPERDLGVGASQPMSDATTPGVYQFEPSAAIAGDGSAVALYITRGGIFEGNVLAVSRAGGPTDEPLLGAPLHGAKAAHFDPWLARDRAGTLYAVWYSFDGRDQHGAIELVRSKDRGTTWSEPASVHDPADCAEPERACFDKPMIAIGPAPVGSKGERMYVLYSAEDAGLRVRASADGGTTFGSPVTALAGIYGNVGVGADGRLHVVTLNGGPMGGFGSAQQRVEYTVSSDGGRTFAAPLVVSRPDEVLPFFFANPSVVVDDRRRWLYVAYVRGGRDARWDLVLAATKDGGKTWTRQTIGDGCAIHMVPNLALDPSTGAVHVAWYDSVGAPGRFAHAVCAPGLVKCTPQGAINSLPFAALSTERHGAKWVGEYAALVVDDARRVMHAFWTQPVAEGDRVVSRIFHAGVKLPRR